MTIIPKILAFAGSTRTGSVNKKLLRVAATAARDAGAEVTVIDLRDLALPLYDGDLEESNGLPEGAKKLKELMKSHHGLLLACPEYNSSISPALKNAVDWASRPMEGEKPLEPFTGKVAALTSASPGALGGLRGLVTVRSLLGNIGVLVLPEQVSVGKAHEAFAEDGSLLDTKRLASIQALTAKLADAIRKLHS
ncbi:MAG: NADPH-dependent FMN reductase [Candidatus Acidiferrales bacterium]